MPSHLRSRLRNRGSNRWQEAVSLASGSTPVLRGALELPWLMPHRPWIPSVQAGRLSQLVVLSSVDTQEGGRLPVVAQPFSGVSDYISCTFYPCDFLILYMET